MSVFAWVIPGCEFGLYTRGADSLDWTEGATGGRMMGGVSFACARPSGGTGL